MVINTKTMKKIIGWAIITVIVLWITSFSCNFFNNAGNVVKKEFFPEALLKKYEYFKDLSSAIDKKRADIEMYKAEISDFKTEDKNDKIYLQSRKVELIGIISMHNQLCAEYNSAMSKFNYRFTNAGDLPETNLEPLPREYKPYLTNLK